MQLKRWELNAMLTGLRLVEAWLEGDEEVELTGGLFQVLTDGATPPPTPEEVNALCERVNTAPQELGETNALDAFQAFCATRAGPLTVAKDPSVVPLHGLGLAGEAGEVCDYLKKHLLHHHPFSREKLTSELGDVLWYVGILAYLHDVKLSDVAAANVAKLKARYPEGFSVAASLARADEKP